MEQNAPIIYLDESSFNSWCTANKVWQKRDSPVEVVINPQRTAVTVYGAIGNVLNSPIFTTGNSTNKEDFMRFLALIKNQVLHL
jgi:hypothetical protein